MRSRPTWWFIFGAAALVVVAALVWVTCAVLNLERREMAARAEARQQEALRLALWRMDSWLSPRLAREAARPYFEYKPYYEQTRSYTNMFNEIAPGEVLTPSPLLTFSSEYFPIHFQINADGTITSPQVPAGNERDLAEATALTGAQIDANQARLDELARVIDREALAKRIDTEESRLAVISNEAAMDTRERRDEASEGSGVPMPQLATQSGAAQAPVQNQWSQREYQQRAMSSNRAQQADANANELPVQTLEPEIAGGLAIAPQGQSNSGRSLNDDRSQPRIDVGPLVSMWLAGQSSIIRPLLFVRRVGIGDEQCYQGFVADWPQLRAAMLGQINDLFPTARLAMVPDDVEPNGDPAARKLATVPAELITPPPQAMAMPSLSPTRITLAITWLAVIGAIVAGGLTLHHSIAYAAKRSRFTSAVTHELRTPLTTFRMYSEMLAENMVRDESQRRTYLQTLKSESARLANLVENVLAYARLEEGRSPRHPQTMTVPELFERVRPMLERRAAEADLAVRFETGLPQMTPMAQKASARPRDAGASGSQSVSSVANLPRSITVDADAVGQILFNLVDNACKYASGPEASPRTIDIGASVQNGQARLTVRDHGPGIDNKSVRSIFQPFDRGRHGPDDTIPGVGLGLALARGLARDLGGELSLKPSDGGSGAAFVLTVPVSK
jgi:signal transduction histidine kinase